MSSLFQTVNELRAAVERADNERLSVWVEQFEQEYPDLALEVRRCANMASPGEVVTYLIGRDSRFSLLGLIPDINPIIEFLMNFIRERSNDGSDNHPNFGNAVYALPPATKRRRVHT